MHKPNAFNWRQDVRPCIFLHDNRFNGRGPSKLKRVNLAPQRGSAFTAPITRPDQSDRTNSIARRL